MKKIRTGINTTKKNWLTVYNHATRDELNTMLDFDETLISETPDKQVVMKSLRDAEVVLSAWGAVPYDMDVLDQCPNLKIIFYAAGTVTYFVTEELLKRKIRIGTASHINARPVAEFTLGIILTALKNVPQFNAELKAGKKEAWKRFDGLTYRGGYYGKKIGLIGLGNISKLLIQLLKPFDFEVFVCSEHLTPELARTYGVTSATLESIMEKCEVISIHVADLDKNQNLINRNNLKLLKENAILINTARGRPINEPDLVTRLKEGNIWAYLDVSHPEPPEDDHPFYSLENCYLTPHIAGSAGSEVERMGMYCLRELKNWIDGKPLENEFDFSKLDIRA